MLGPLEQNILEILWDHGEGTVNDVTPHLSRPLAYTTVMTTLDRLYKKGLLARRREDRAYVYSARHNREEFERRRADDFMTEFLAGPEPARGILLSCLIDSIGRTEPALLDELEARIRARRQELDGSEKP